VRLTLGAGSQAQDFLGPCSAGSAADASRPVPISLLLLERRWAVAGPGAEAPALWVAAGLWCSSFDGAIFLTVRPNESRVATVQQLVLGKPEPGWSTRASSGPSKRRQRRRKNRFRACRTRSALSHPEMSGRIAPATQGPDRAAARQDRERPDAAQGRHRGRRRNGWCRAAQRRPAWRRALLFHRLRVCGRSMSALAGRGGRQSDWSTAHVIAGA